MQDSDSIHLDTVLSSQSACECCNIHLFWPTLEHQFQWHCRSANAAQNLHQKHSHRRFKSRRERVARSHGTSYSHNQRWLQGTRHAKLCCTRIGNQSQQEPRRKPDTQMSTVPQHNRFIPNYHAHGKCVAFWWGPCGWAPAWVCCALAWPIFSDLQMLLILKIAHPGTIAGKW